jgi:hypothetical protein
MPTPVSAHNSTPDHESTNEKTPLAKKRSKPALSSMIDLKEEEEHAAQTPKQAKTPRKSEVDTGFSDFNPFQSGSEDAAEKERRRRKVSRLCKPVRTYC